MLIFSLFDIRCCRKVNHWKVILRFLQPLLELDQCSVNILVDVIIAGVLNHQHSSSRHRKRKTGAETVESVATICVVSGCCQLLTICSTTSSSRSSCSPSSWSLISRETTLNHAAQTTLSVWRHCPGEKWTKLSEQWCVIKIRNYQTREDCGQGKFLTKRNLLILQNNHSIENKAI